MSDGPIPSGYRARVQLYTLACARFLEALPVIDQCILACDDDSLSLDKCILTFEQALQWALQNDSSQTVHQNFAAKWVLDSTPFETRCPGGGQAIKVAAGAIVRDFPRWDYKQHFDQLKEQGRLLAVEFYSRSPHQITLDRLKLDCEVELLYNEKVEPAGRLADRASPGEVARTLRNDAPSPIGVTSLGPGAKIQVRFGPRVNFVLYLAYPFLFLHEFFSHVFAIDHRAHVLSDGWLMFAAQHFLARRAASRPDEIVLDPRQNMVYDSELLFRITGQPAEGDRLARRIANLLPNHEHFLELTYNLAAIELRPGEDKTWLVVLMKRLLEAFKKNEASVIRLIEETRNPRRLLARL